MIQAPTTLDATLPHRLHRGEIEALSLARELQADWVLIDDWDARQAAKACGLPLAGTPNILEEAAVRGLIVIEDAIDRLKKTNYRATEAQYQAIVENVNARKSTKE